MNLIHTSLTHKILPPQEQSGALAPALVLLHGRGANEDDLLGLSEYLDQRFLFIAPRAPFPFQFGGGFTWYDLVDIGKPEPKMFAESYQRLTQFFGDIKEGYPIDPKKIFFLGFSMGSMMAYAYALTNPGTVAGVVANSGYIPEDTNLKFQWENIGGTSFFVAHGLNDPVIPVEFGRRAKELLLKARAEVTYHEYEMGHQINEESLHDMSKWLEKKI